MKKILLLMAVALLGTDAISQSLLEQYPLDYGFAKGVNGTVGLSGFATEDRASNAEGAMKFNGNNRLNLGDLTIDPSAGLTIMFWVKPSSSMTGNRSWLGNRSVCGAGSFFDIRGNATTSVLSMEVYQLNAQTAGVGGITYTPDQWQHISFVMDQATKSTKAYVNGDLVSTLAWTNTKTLTSFTTIKNLYWSNSPCIGGDGTTGFIGDVDDIRIYNSALELSTLKQIASESAATPVKNFTLEDTEVYHDDLDMNCLNDPAIFAPDVTATLNRDGDLNSAAAFNGTTAVLNTQRVTDVDPLKSTVIEGSSIAISAWIKTDGLEENGFIVAAYADGTCNTSGMNRIIFRTVNGVLQGYFVFPGNKQAIVNSSIAITPNVWHHVVMNFEQPYFDMNNVEFYVDGVKGTNSLAVTTNNPVSHDGLVIPASTNAVTSIGGSLKSTTEVCNNVYGFKGSIDDVRIYSHPLTMAQVTDLHNETPLDNSLTFDVTTKLSYEQNLDFADQNALITAFGTKMSGVTPTSDRHNNPTGAVDFDGMNAYISTGINLDSVFADGDPFSYSVWIRPDGAMANNLILGHSGDGACEDRRQQYFRVLDGKLSFTAAFSLTNGGSHRHWVGSTVLSTGTDTWYHVAVTVNQPITGNNDVKIYLNGVLETTTATFSGVSTGVLNANNTVFGIGNYLKSDTEMPCNQTDDASFKGGIDDVKVYDRILCLQDIDALANDIELITGLPSDLETANVSNLSPNPSSDGVFQLNNAADEVLSVSTIGGVSVSFIQNGKILTVNANSGLYIVLVKTVNGVSAQRVQVIK